MPSYKDEKSGTWYYKFYYMDWSGIRRQKLKRGFKLQREAKEWEYVKMTMNTYSHLFQSHQKEIIDKLEKIKS